MVRVRHILFLLCFLGNFCLIAQQGFDPDAQLELLTGNKNNAGIVAGYSVDGEIRWEGSAGLSCRETGVPMDTNTLTRIASISKNFTAVAVMQLVERDLISLDTPVISYLPDLPEDKKEITVRQLMAHTSGIPQYQNEREIENTIHYNSLEEAMDVFISRPLLFQPGSSYFYTTYGYVILGRVIESVTGLSYGQYMKERVLDVAGMDQTGIEVTGQSYDNKSCLYHNNGRKVREGTQNDLSNRVPGGGYYSTLYDLLKFGNALLANKLISTNSLETMLKTQPVEYDSNKYGLGWYLYGPPPYENLVIGHSGGQTGCTSQLMIVPKTKTVVVVLSNTSGTYPEIATFASNLITHSETLKE